ncbi:MAG: TlpA disulfide reductase family protein [Chitinophagaceae bacterium]
MKFFISIYAFSIFFCFGKTSRNIRFITQIPSPDEVLKKTVERLQSFNSINYRHQRDYFTGDKHILLDGYSFIDFNSVDTIIHLKYLIKSGVDQFFFNGTETFRINVKEKTIKINNKPDVSNIEGESFFYNSIVSLRRTLPLIIEDKSINKKLMDTVINNNCYYLISFSLYKKTLNPFGGYSPVTESRTFIFQLLIDKNSYLPYMLIQTNNADEHSSKITYTNIEMNKQADEKNWYYSTYVPAFKIVSAKREVALLPVGFEAPTFELSLFESGKKVNSQQYKNKVLLLEFWIRNCGPCIESVPKLNNISEKYKSKGIEVLAVNPIDTKPTVAYFVDKYKPNYVIAYNSEKVAEKFGVSAFPSVFILNLKGEIIYSGVFDYDTIIKTIEKEIM